MKVKILLLTLLMLWGCVSVMDNKAGESMMFPGYTGKEVWRASMNSLLDKWHCIITISDMDAGLIQAQQATPGLVSTVSFKWTVQVFEGRDGVNLNVHLEKDVGFLYKGASKLVVLFVQDVRKRLEEGEGR